MSNQIIEFQQIQNRIFTLSGVQVMLDRDLAELYQVKAIRLREQVKRNKKRFPPDFMFQLTNNEVDFLVSQNAIPSKKHLGGYLPYVFTEQGVANLSSVLNSERAIEVNIQIMRAFVEMRRVLANNAFLFQRVDNVEQKQIKLEIETKEKFDIVFDALQSKDVKPKQSIFYDGQIFDAYVFIADLIKSAKKSILLIDNFIDESILQLFTKRNKNVRAVIYTKNITKILKQDVKKHNSQYPKIEIKEFTKAHDRFMIIDQNTIYHFGASLKDLGKKWFAFSKMEIDAIDMLNRLLIILK
ncbi:MAG: ORF6N domain-containing protein [Bacteroidales bacterium]|nr:ORF6N domain-containing protein [Bacteroidales bacterium]